VSAVTDVVAGTLPHGSRTESGCRDGGMIAKVVEAHRRHAIPISLFCRGRPSDARLGQGGHVDFPRLKGARSGGMVGTAAGGAVAFTFLRKRRENSSGVERTAPSFGADAWRGASGQEQEAESQTGESRDLSTGRNRSAPFRPIVALYSGLALPFHPGPPCSIARLPDCSPCADRAAALSSCLKVTSSGLKPDGGQGQ